MPQESSILAELLKAENPVPLDPQQATPEQQRGEKKNFAERLSREIATKIANSLRPRLPAITPDEHGKQQEEPALSVKGPKKLDVNYSTTRYGLGLGVSVKTINAKDPKTKRYTKNYSRVDNELRAEAMDYHKRQPFAVMVAVIFLPIDACDDGKPRKVKNPLLAVGPPLGDPSSFGKAAKDFRLRANRQDPKNDVDLFEAVYIGLYEPSGPDKGDVMFFNVMDPPPKYGRPVADSLITFDAMIEKVYGLFLSRNEPEFRWAESPPNSD